MQSLERRREGSRSSSPADAHMGSKGGGFSYSPTPPRRPRPYGKLLLLAFAAAAVCLLVFHRQREKRVLGLLLEEHEQELHSLHVLLQSEKDISEEMKKKIEDLQETAISLRSQKTELAQKLAEAQNVAGYLKGRQSHMELEREDSQKKIKLLRAMESDFAKARNQIKLLKSELERQEGKYSSLKQSLDLLSTKQDNVTLLGGEMNMNGTLPNNSIEHGESQSEKGKLVKDEAKDFVEQHEGIENKDKVRIASNPDSSGVSTGTTDKEVDHLKEVGESESQGVTLEGQGQASNNTDGVLAAADLSIPNGTIAEEPKNNSAYIEPEITGDTHHEAKLQEIDGSNKDQTIRIRTENNHPHPVKQRRRRHKVLGRSIRTSSIGMSEQFQEEERGGANEGKSSEGTGENLESAVHRENDTTLDTGDMKAGVLDVKVVATSDKEKLIELGHGNDMNPGDGGSMQRETREHSGTAEGDQGTHGGNGEDKELLEYTSIPSGMVELAAHDTQGHQNGNAAHTDHAIPLELTVTGA